VRPTGKPSSARPSSERRQRPWRGPRSERRPLLDYLDRECAVPLNVDERPDKGRGALHDAHPHHVAQARTERSREVRRALGKTACASGSKKFGAWDAEAILRRFTRTNVQHPTYRALAEFGKAERTTFSADTCG
jgi:hypothetical protein